MNAQLSLALETPIAGRSRVTDPPTSVAAGRSVNATAQISRIHNHLASSRFGFTRGEIAEATGIRSDQVSSRLSVMETLGMAGKAGTKVCRVTGHSVTRWQYRSPSPIVDVRVAGERL